MIDVQLVKTEGCSHCAQVKEILEKIKPDFPGLHVEEVLMTTPKGQKLVQEHGILASPGVIINGKLTFTGGGNEKQIREALKQAH